MPPQPKSKKSRVKGKKGKRARRGKRRRNSGHAVGQSKLRKTPLERPSGDLWIISENLKEEVKVQLYDENDSQWLEIDVPGKKITLQTDEGDIHIEAKNTITMKCTDLEIDASNSIKVTSGAESQWDAGSSMTQTSGSTFDIDAGGTLTEKAPKIDLNP